MVGGRRQGGGQRCGEMEVDGITSHGSSSLLDSVINISSDGTEVYVCKSCNQYSDDPKGTRMSIKTCSNCGSQIVKKVQSTHSSNLLFKQLTSLGIQTRIHLE